jgi:hypothetical protein
MTRYRTIAGIAAVAAVLAALPSASLADPAAQEYLPQVSQAGVNGSSPADQKKGGSDDDKAVLPVAGSGGGSGGDSSGSLLLNPIVLLMIAAVIAAAVTVTLWRRRADETAEGDKAAPEPEVELRHRQGTPRTPDGEIIGPDQAG